MQAKVRTWMDGVEATELVGVSARFGETIKHQALEINALMLAVPSPANSCDASVLPVSNETPSVQISAFFLLVVEQIGPKLHYY